MANTFKNSFAKDMGTSAVVIYSATTQTTVIGLTLANTTTSVLTVDVYITSSATNYYLVKGATIPPGGALVPVGGDQKLVLESGDSLRALSSLASSVDVICSVLEIT